MLVHEECQKAMGKTPEIREFFAGQSVLITGGTGFIGAVVLEKLLRVCPEIATVYLLIRPKKLVDVQDRLGALFDSGVSQTYLHLLPHFPCKKFRASANKFVHLHMYSGMKI
jgi:FlaA1/EpsC-like NDP-sugar epimerase